MGKGQGGSRPIEYIIKATPSAKDSLAAITDLSTRKKIIDKIDGLKKEPVFQGKPLTGPLLGYQSIPAAGRYRVIYKIVNDLVVVFLTGIRKESDHNDIYRTMLKLVNSGLLK